MKATAEAGVNLKDKFRSKQKDASPISTVTINPISPNNKGAGGQRRAEYNQLVLDIRYEVATAYEQAEESRRVWQLYNDRLVPTAEQNVSAARSNYDVNKTSFLDLAVAQRQLVDLREKREEALAQYHGCLAELTRAIGGILPLMIGEQMPEEPLE